MGIQINGNTDTVASTTSGGSVTLPSATLPAVSNISATRVNVSGVSTFTTGPVLIGSGTSTGTESQPLQVTGGAYVSGSTGIGVTNPDVLFHINGTNSYPASLGSTPTGYLALRKKAQGATHGLYVGVAPAPPYGSWLQAQDANNLATNYPLLLNPNGGNIGIGTISPQYALDVFSTPNSEPYAVIRTASSLFGGFLAQGTSQAHLRFVTGGQWDDAGAKKWQIRVGAASGIDDFRIYSWTKSDDVIKINNSGHLQIPYQPCWNVGRNSTQTISNGTATNIIFNQSTGNDCFLQGGCTLDTSTGRVTVPVAGKYLLVASIRTEATGSSTGTNLQFQRNGTTLQRYYVGTGSANSGGNYMYISPMPYIATASANDYFEIRFDAVVGTFELSAASNTVVRFMGYLIG